MNTLHIPLTRRLIAALAAGTTTLALFGAVVSLSEPGRDPLIARQPQTPPAATPATVMAHADAAGVAAAADE